MGQLILIAARNLVVHTRRTLFLGGAITFTSFLLVMMLGLTHGIRTTILETATVLMSGHLNVGGFYKVTAGQSAPVVVNAEKIATLLKAQVPEIDYITQRGRGWAKLVSETSSVQAGVGGIDIANEPRFREVVKVVDGSFDELSKPGTVLMFQEQAEKLGVKPGDTVSLSAPTLRGTNNIVDLRVAAIAQNLGLLSSWNIYIPNQTLRTLYQLNEHATGVLQIYVKELKGLPDLQVRVRKVLEAGGYQLLEPDPRAFWMKFEKVNREDWTGQRLDVTSWEEELSFLQWVLITLTWLTRILVTLLLVVVSIGLMNTLWIAIRERTREIGTLRAIGMQRGPVVMMFLTEAVMLATFGVVVGTLLGLLAQVGLNAAGIHVPLAAQFFVMRETLHFAPEPVSILTGGAVIILAMLLVSLFPSFLAARLKPITAMHHLGVIEMRTGLWLGLFVAVAAQAVEAPKPAMDAAALGKLLQTIDDRQRNPGDFKSIVYLEQKERDKTDVVREVLVYRRGADRKLLLLFTKPKGEAGKGYLRLESNLWSYDPNTGKWERRTERERIAGTDSRRADFDESRLYEEYTPAFEGQEKLGAFTVNKLTLTAKEGVDVAYPVVKLWVDVATDNVLKRQELALSGRLMRTLYYPKWQKLYSESKKSDVWFAQEIRIYDEVEKANSTLMLIKDVDPRPVEANLFTKAWLESKSR